MARVESRALLDAQERLVEMYSLEHRFTSANVCEIHRVWLNTIYPWAGQYRGVNIAKGGFDFAAAREVPRLMNEFERRELAQYTPCRFGTESETARALAIVRADLPPLDFGAWSGKGERGYIAAIHAAMGTDYEPMVRLFRGVIRRSYERYGKRGQ